MRPRLRAYVVASALAVPGCSLIIGTSGLTGEPAATAAGEDAGPNQDTSVADAPAGEAPMGDGAVTPFCAPFADAAFCDDFDKSKPVERWSGEYLDGFGGALALAHEQGEVFLRSTLVSNSGVGRAHLFKTMARAPATRMRFGFRIRTHGYPAIDTQTSLIEMVEQTTRWVYVLFARAGSFSVFEQRFSPDGFKIHELTKSPSPDAWSRVTLEISWAEQPARLSVTVDGAPAMSQPSETGVIRATPRVLVGANWADPSPPFVIDVDDALVEMD